MIEITYDHSKREIEKRSDHALQYNTAGFLSEVENKAKALQKYDPNLSLKLCGLKELTNEQLSAFEKWWDAFFDMYMLGSSKDDHLFWWMKSVDTKNKVKAYLEKSD